MTHPQRLLVKYLDPVEKHGEILGNGARLERFGSKWHTDLVGDAAGRCG